MSVNRYNASTGELTSLATGSRTWVGTREAYEQAKQAGTLPNNCLIAITDDEKDHNHYSTEETLTGMYWIDGKPIYRKAIDVGNLPNSSRKSVDTGIADIAFLIDLYGSAWSATDIKPLPYVALDTTNAQYHIGCWVAKGSGESTWSVWLETKSNRSDMTGVVVIEYTKTTD